MMGKMSVESSVEKSNKDRVRKSHLTLEDALEHKTKYYDDFDALNVEVNKYLQDKGNFKKADKLIEKAYRFNMQMNKFRMEVAATEEITPEIKSKLIQVIELEADAVDGLYRGMAESRDGGGYQAGFRYSSASIEAFREEDIVLQKMLK